MAWQRTGIAATALGAVVTLGVARSSGMLLIALSSCVTAFAAASAGMAATRAQPGLSDRLPSPWPRLVWTSGAVVLLASLGLALVFLPG